MHPDKPTQPISLELPSIDENSRQQYFDSLQHSLDLLVQESGDSVLITKYMHLRALQDALKQAPNSA